MPGKKSIILTCLIFFVDCNFKECFKSFVPEEADKFARDYIDMLRKGDFEQAEKLLDPQFVSPETHSKLQEVAHLLNQGELISIEIVGSHAFSTADKNKKRSDLTYQLQFKNAWLLAKIIVDNISGKQQIFGIHVNPISKSLKEINAFMFSGKTFVHYVILLFAIGVPIFVIYTIVLCARTKINRKWLWIIFILIGVGKLSLNWTSGQMGFQPISFQILGAAAFRGGLYGPWIISISFPLGSLVFLLKKHKIKKREFNNISATSEPGMENHGT